MGSAGRLSAYSLPAQHGNLEQCTGDITVVLNGYHIANILCAL